MKTELILIGGVPGTGKTTIAYNLALRLKIDKVLSIDMVKIFAKTYCHNLDKYFLTTTHEAYKLENLSITDGYLRHCNIVNNIVLEVIKNIKDNIIIVEGSTINKDFLNLLDKEKYHITYFNLSLPTNSLIGRYKQKEQLRKSNWIENIYVIEKIGEYLCQSNFNIVNDNIDFTMERILEYVKKNIFIQ